MTRKLPQFKAAHTPSKPTQAAKKLPFCRLSHCYRDSDLVCPLQKLISFDYQIPRQTRTCLQVSPTMAEHEEPETKVHDFCTISGASPELVRSKKADSSLSCEEADLSH